jgi:hypothetical protein
LDSGLAVGNAGVPADHLSSPPSDPFVEFLPAIFDLDAAQVNPIAEPFIDPPLFNGRNLVHSVLHGPFARVDIPGSCLRVRAEPGLDGDILDCAVGGVLLSDSGEVRTLEDGDWAILSALALLAACVGDDVPSFAPTLAVTPTPSPTTTASPSPQATPSPTPKAQPSPTPADTIDSVDVIPLQTGHEVDLPENTALIVATGCSACDSPPSGLVRVYLDPSGDIRSEILFSVERVGDPPFERETDTGTEIVPQDFIGFALSDDASEVVVAVCTRGFCGGLGFATPDAETTLFRSVDGGVSWSEFGVLEGGLWITALTAQGVLLSDRRDPEERGAAPKYQIFPGGSAVIEPAGVGRVWPISLPDGELGWRTEGGGILLADGTDFLPLFPETLSMSPGGTIHSDPEGGRLALGMYVTASDSPVAQRNLVVAPLDGSSVVLYAFDSRVRLGPWLNSSLIVGNVDYAPDLLQGLEPTRYLGTIPVLFDLETGNIHAIPHPFFDQSFPIPNILNAIVAVQHGPFARVDIPGSCLRVRAEPGLEGEILDCVADGVLLRDTGEVRTLEDGDWLRVVTPVGLEGWSSVDYLER